MINKKCMSALFRLNMIWIKYSWDVTVVWLKECFLTASHFEAGWYLSKHVWESVFFLKCYWSGLIDVGDMLSLIRVVMLSHVYKWTRCTIYTVGQFRVRNSVHFTLRTTWHHFFRKTIRYWMTEGLKVKIPQ